MKFKHYYLNNLNWAGTEESLHLANSILADIEQCKQSGSFKSIGINEDEDERLYDVEDGTAIIRINGPLLNVGFSKDMADFFGFTTYPILQQQFTQLLDDEEVERVVLYVNSGGGDVSGLNDTHEILKTLNSVKPVATFASDMMASAAYWLGSTSQMVYASSVAITGSIGVIAVHASYKEMYEREGIKPYVMRAGENKHLGHHLEDFTEKAREDKQRSLDFTHNMFITAVAENRNMSPTSLKAGIADGRVFYGQEAVDVGLIDKISTFGSFMETWKEKTKSNQKPSGFVTATVVTTQQVSHGDNGMTLEELQAQVASLQSELSLRETALVETQTRVSTLETELSQANATKDALAASLAETKEYETQLASLLDANIQAKANALGLEVFVPSALADKQGLNAQLEEKFQASFPSGGVAASVAAENLADETQTSAPSWFKNVIR